MSTKTNTPPPRQREVMSLREVSEVLGVSRKTMHRHLNDGTLKGTKVGGKWMVPNSAIEKITGKRDK